MSYSVNCIDPRHRDLLHDIAFDYYGKRMATCSSDQSIKVWDLDPITQEWKETTSWKAHSGSVWKVTWAHPDFGQILATCSFDRTAAVWEEITTEGKCDKSVQWIRRTNFVDSRTSVTDVKFAPKILGLVLATCSVDGLIRVYEAPDTMNLCQWTLLYEVVCKLQSSCIAWNTPIKCDGFNDTKSKIKIPSNVERNKDIVYMPDDYNRNVVRCPISLEKKDTSIIIPQKALMAVGSDDSSSTHKLVIFQFPLFSQRLTKPDLVFPITDPVYDLAFAPRMGRGYDLLAVATVDIKLFSICLVMSSMNNFRYEVVPVIVVSDQPCSVWRVGWNILGSMMATSGDDGVVRLWRSFPYQDPSVSKRIEVEKGLPHEVEVERKKIAYDFNLFISGIQSAWKCTHAFKGDDQVKSPEGIQLTKKGVDPISTRYIKLANISHPSRVPRH